MVKRVSEKRTCYFCNSVEDEVRIIGSFVVTLKEMDYKGDTVLACQSCSRKKINYQNFEDKHGSKKKFGFFGFKK